MSIATPVLACTPVRLLVLALGVGLGTFLFAAAPAHAVPPAAGTTTTTVLTLSTPVQTQVDALAAQALSVQGEIDALNEALQQKAEEYNKCLEDADGANSRMAELRRKLADAQADKARQQTLLAERLKSVYKSGGRDRLLQLLLLADGIDDLYKRVRLVATLAEQDQRLVADLKESSARLDLLTKAVDEQKRQQLQMREDLTRRAAEIEATVAEREQTLAALDGRVAAMVEQERQRQKKEQERLQRELQARLAAEAAAASRVAARAAANQSLVFNGGQVYRGTLPHTDDATANQLIETAAAYMGIPYVWGGSRPSSGMDCSGFVRYVFKQHGVKLPHYSGYQAQMGIPVELADIRPGDIVAFGFPVHHVGIYIGNGYFIHTPGDYVKIQKLSSRRNLSAIRRFPFQMRSGLPLFE